MTRILIVENESVVAWHIQEALENLAHTVVGFATSGVQAIQLAAEAEPELVLMDIKLEGEMDGVAAAQEIYTRFNIPVVYLTAHADNCTLRRATSTDPFGYLIKPFQEQELHTTILIALRRHQLERNLRARQQWFATTLNSIGDATIATDLKGIITFMNPVAEALTGWQQQDAVGNDVSTVLKLIDKETRQAIENPGIRAMELNTPVSLPDGCLLCAKDNTEEPVGDTASPIKNKEGEVIGSIVVFQSIANRQHAAAELQQRHLLLEQYQLSLNAQLQERTIQLQQALACTQVIKRITDDNSLDERQILQLTIQELGRALEADYCWVSLHDEEYAIATIACEYIFLDIENRPSLIDTEIYLQNYPRFYFQLFRGECWLSPPLEILPTAYQSLVTTTTQLLVCPICNEQQVIGEVGILTSGKPWSKLQAELISQVISQSTVAIRVARLEQAAQAHVGELELLNNLKYDFITSVSHELRTPLANIRMAVEMLHHLVRSIKSADTSKEALPDKQRLWQKLEQYLQILQDEWQQEFNLVSDLLNFKSEATESLSLSLIDFQQWLPSIVNRFTLQAAKQRQNLIFDFPQQPIVAPDAPSLERILTELLNNACKFTPTNQDISVTVKVEGNKLILKVTNTGVEIPPEELDRIFQPFYRIPRPNAWNYSGMGLGLALVKKLVLSLGGEIQVKSTNGKTTFLVILPLS